MSEDNVNDLETRGFDPYIAVGRQKHNQSQPPEADLPPAEATPKERMAQKLRTESGRETYAKRKHIVEPVFGQMKQARGFRPSSIRSTPNHSGPCSRTCFVNCNAARPWSLSSSTKDAIEDVLSSNAPHIRELQDHNIHYILGVKEGDHGFLFEHVRQAESAGRVTVWEYVEEATGVRRAACGIDFVFSTTCR